MKPSDTLLAAADRIRDLAAATTKPRKPEFGWGFLDADELGDASNGTVVASSGWGGSNVVAERVGWGDAEWIAALSPATAPAIERWLRETSRHVRTFGENADGWAAAPAMEFARAVLGSGVDTP